MFGVEFDPVAGVKDKDQDFSVKIVVTVTLTKPIEADKNGKLTDTARIVGTYSGDSAKAPLPIAWEGSTFVGEDGMGKGGKFGTATAAALTGDAFDASTGAKEDNETKIQSMRGTLTMTWDPKKQAKGNGVLFGNQSPKSISVEVAR